MRAACISPVLLALQSIPLGNNLKFPADGFLDLYHRVHLEDESGKHRTEFVNGHRVITFHQHAHPTRRLPPTHEPREKNKLKKSPRPLQNRPKLSPRAPIYIGQHFRAPSPICFAAGLPDENSSKTGQNRTFSGICQFSASSASSEAFSKPPARRCAADEGRGQGATTSRIAACRSFRRIGGATPSRSLQTQATPARGFEIASNVLAGGDISRPRGR